MEELGEVADFVIDDLLVVQVVVWLEVDARICHEKEPLDFN